MLRNYLKIAWRNLLKNKAFSLINIGGLSVGMATCLLITLYIIDELGYDKGFENVEQLYRVGTKTSDEKWASVTAPVAQALKKDFAEVEQSTRLLKFPNLDKMLFRNSKTNPQGSVSKQFFENNGYYVDSTFFEVFSYQAKYGNLKKALYQPNTMVISESVALKMFGNENPINNTINIEIPFGKTDYLITGVFKENLKKSHINAHFFLSMNNNDLGQWVRGQTSWATNALFHTYFSLKKGADAEKFEAKLDGFYQRNGGADLKATGITKSLFMQPVSDIYLNTSVSNEIEANGSITYIYIFGSIAAFLLLIACINFMNLSTARAEKRAKEVGIRKAIGAIKSSLVGQFLTESVMMCLISLCFALILVQLFLPIFNQLTIKQLSLFQSSDSLFWIPIIAIITSVLAGLYPSFYLASFRPIEILKGKLVNHISANFIRKGLVVFQFAISITLIFAVVIIWQQMNLIRNQDLGFNKNQQIILPLQSTTSANKVSILKNEILKKPEVVSVTSGSSYPGVQLIEDQMFYAAGKSKNENVDIHFVRANEDYTTTLGYKILYGRTLSTNPKSDSNAIVLNQAALKKLGIDPKNAIGKQIFNENNGVLTSKEIVGVIKDFNYRSLHEAITPYGLIKLFSGEQASYLIANVNTSNFKNTINSFETIWKKINPETPFEYSFLDQQFQKNYEKEERTARIIIYFTLIAIVIACLGLFGLAAFTAEQRTKEIGIRKVLGASIFSITQLLSYDFIKLVLIANLFALPLGYWAMMKWLQNFAYKIDISWWIFVLSAILAISIALLTVSYQAIKAALMNPVKSLKTE